MAPNALGSLLARAERGGYLYPSPLPRDGPGTDKRVSLKDLSREDRVRRYEARVTGLIEKYGNKLDRPGNREVLSKDLFSEE